jgi:hypothetical protein
VGAYECLKLAKLEYYVALIFLSAHDLLCIFSNNIFCVFCYDDVHQFIRLLDVIFYLGHLWIRRLPSEIVYENRHRVVFDVITLIAKRIVCTLGARSEIILPYTRFIYGSVTHINKIAKSKVLVVKHAWL